MALSGIFATQLTPILTRSLSIWVGGRDVTGDVQYDSFSLHDIASNAVGSCSFRIEGSINTFREVRDGVTVKVYDHTQNSDLFFGFVVNRHGIRHPQYNSIEITAASIESLLDASIIGWEKRPVETDQARLGYLWGKYAKNPLSGDFTRVKSANGLAALPAVNFAWVTLREAIEMVAASSASNADYYVDNYGRLHFFATETNAAPFDINADAPGGGQFAPESLEVTYDSGSLANRVTVQTTTVGRSYQDEQAMADVDGVERNTVVPAPDIVTAAHAAQVASFYLARMKNAKPRGTFACTSPDGDGLSAGQTINITSADLNLTAYASRIYGVTTKVKLGSATGNPTYGYEVEWGGLKPKGYRWQ